MGTAIRLVLVIIMTLVYTFGYTQSTDTIFNKIYQQIVHKNYLQAAALDHSSKSIPVVYQHFIKACLNNAFNRIEASQKNIELALKTESDWPDSLKLMLYEIKKDNHVKRHEYKEAAAALNILLNKYAQQIDDEKKKDLSNDLMLWSALTDIPKQTVVIKDNTSVKITQDKVGLKNLRISNGKDSMNFIFDTGANISTVSMSAAQKMGIKIIPAAIEVGSITGKKVKAKLGVCKKLYVGDIEISHAVFLVFDDNDLSFPQMNYQINGILGFPVIEAMKEIQITRDGYFKVPLKENNPQQTISMALNELIPVIFIDSKPYTFDTGADHTIFYNPYFEANNTWIRQNFIPTTIAFGGAGGGRKVNGYKVNIALPVSGKNVYLHDADLITDNIQTEKGIYGNIGQDVIGQFSSMILNFHKMFIAFDE